MSDSDLLRKRLETLRAKRARDPQRRPEAPSGWSILDFNLLTASTDEEAPVVSDGNVIDFKIARSNKRLEEYLSLQRQLANGSPVPRNALHRAREWVYHEAEDRHIRAIYRAHIQGNLYEDFWDIRAHYQPLEAGTPGDYIAPNDVYREYYAPRDETWDGDGDDPDSAA